MKSIQRFGIWMVILLLLMAVGCSNGGTDPGNGDDNGNGNNGNGDDVLLTVEELFPMENDVRYVYEGSGNEYASFYTVVDYLEGNKIQRRTDNGGTQTVEVIQVDTGVVERLYRKGEVYFRENLLKKTDVREVLLMEPIEVGNQWTVSGDGTRTITGIDVEVETPLGIFDTVEVTTEFQQQDAYNMFSLVQGNYDTAITEDAAAEYSGVLKEYYAKDVGLVKRAYVMAEGEVVSELKEIIEDDELVQSVIFYYPDQSSQGYDEYQQVVKEVSFATNQVTRTTLEEAYKEDAPFTVLTEKTTINHLYLNDDGMAYIDVSKDFIDEMNLGAGYESMVLQALANTIGNYYGVDRILLTVDNGLYESGHIVLQQGEYLEADLE